MSKETLQKITFEQLIQRSIQREQDKMKVAEIEVPSIGGTLLLKTIPENKLLDIIEEGQKGNSLSENIAAERKLIYYCCPILQDTKLHQELGIAEPFDVVEKLFDLQETDFIAKEAMKLNGVESFAEEKTEEIKNS
ncbi:hypothetical protein [Clostridium sp. MD294]|uniref:hypothetical protein n=1 Tax=Clostridium sp. MD294 TaxID=97138 RepID=UPI0002C8FD3A|nr:hypothetical protein [Clostridium sp. MD294]NDO45827.1 hypothetical protein [Clostridium sp. MD294]USF30518.1 hypothetical protein C820_001959 [Clostridium sp. MD294]